MSDALRPPVDGDLPTVVRLIGEHSPEPVDAVLVRREWTSPGVELQNDARIEDDAYCLVEDLHEGRAWIDLQGRPSPALLDWAEARASDKGPRLFTGAWSTNAPLLATLQRRGFALVRHSHHMEIDLEQPLPKADWAEGTAVRAFRPGDERTFYDLHQETFEDTWEPLRESYEEWAHWVLRPPDFAPELWFLAAGGEEPAAFAICNLHPTRPELGWVNILGVRRSWRRRGLGRALLLHAFGEFAKRGLRAAGLGVDAQSLTGANRLYEEAGMHVAARFDIYEKTLA